MSNFEILWDILMIFSLLGAGIILLGGIAMAVIIFVRELGRAWKGWDE